MSARKKVIGTTKTSRELYGLAYRIAWNQVSPLVE
jgi:hypothetical protein